MRKMGRVRMALHMVRLVASAAPRTFVLEYFWSVINGLTLAAVPIVLEQIFGLVLDPGAEGLRLAALTGWLLCLLGVYLLTEVSAVFRPFREGFVWAGQSEGRTACRRGI